MQKSYLSAKSEPHLRSHYKRERRFLHSACNLHGTEDNYLLIRCATGISSTISTQSTLAFLGVGLDPTIPSWGASIADGQAFLFFYPYMSVIPGVIICMTVFGFTMLGEGLRDVLDPKLR